MMNDIATNTGINLDNRRLITNHSCCRTAIQMLKDNGLSDSDLQSFSGHRSRESLADYCKTSDNRTSLSELQETELSIIKKTQDIQKTPLREIRVSHFKNSSTRNSGFTIQETSRSSFCNSKVRAQVRYQKVVKPVIAPFKPLVISDFQ
ncbi:uncharacterized protein OCT59_003612 [Rhizophagus irregularis]|uniref:uncharacterized protein n=1 Tax=Rhizophagus irregularis TaxID=588596 RepID=UPI003316B6DE|nr:hypothetical protein OCT59_003612 [Rhizophagus irregularis]